MRQRIPIARAMQPGQHREDDAFAWMLRGGELVGFVKQVLKGNLSHRSAVNLAALAAAFQVQPPAVTVALSVVGQAGSGVFAHEPEIS